MNHDTEWRHGQWLARAFAFTPVTPSQLHYIALYRCMASICIFFLFLLRPALISLASCLILPCILFYFYRASAFIFIFSSRGPVLVPRPLPLLPLFQFPHPLSHFISPIFTHLYPPINVFYATFCSFLPLPDIVPLRRVILFITNPFSPTSLYSSIHFGY